MVNALVVHKAQLPKAQLASRAAQYVRMSTDHQRYSIANQAATIAAYAASRNLTIARTYKDEAESGLRIENRAALRELIADVQSGLADFCHILVYDVSRWGRFQDVDESAHYEFICKKAGVKVAYCAELFDNDGSLMSSIMKNLKRVMAAEYSRELSAKVYAGASRLVSLGFRQGSQPGFGLRRELIDDTGQSRGVLQNGQRKYLQTDHTLLRPGPAHELEVVRYIFDEFVSKRKSKAEIARQLNRQGVENLHRRPWTRDMVHYLLGNENYIGNLLYNRRSNKLRQGPKVNPPDCWVRGRGGFEPIVDPEVFAKAQKILRARYISVSNEEMLKRLRILLKEKGRLSKEIIDAASTLPCTTLYQLRFGSLRNAYRLIDYRSTRECHYIDTREERTRIINGLAFEISTKVDRKGGTSDFHQANSVLTLNGALNVSIRVARSWTAPKESMVWTIYRRARLPDGLILVVRLDALNEHPIDYFLLPTTEMIGRRIRFSENTRVRLEKYRHGSREAVIRSVIRRAKGSANRASQTIPSQPKRLANTPPKPKSARARR